MPTTFFLFDFPISVKNPYLPRCSWNILQIRGSHSPDIVQGILRFLTMPSLNYTIAGTLILHSTIFRSKGYWFLLLETFAATRRPLLHHYEFDNVKALGSQRIFQSDTPLLLCLSGMFPLSDPWYSSHSPSHRPSTSLLCVLQLSLSRTTPHRYSVGD